MNSYKFLLDWEDVKAGEVLTREQLTAKGVTDEIIGGGLADGTIELVLEDSPVQQEQMREDHLAEEPATPVMKYEGKDVAYDGVREVEGKQYHHIRTTDGASYDLTDEEYARIVEAVQ